MRIRSTLIGSSLVALLLTTGFAHAQAISPLGGSTNNAGTPPPALATPTPAPAAAPATTPSAHASSRHSMDERFAAANTTHDGKLTLTQAKAGHLRAVARDFAQIDTSKRGYVTLDEIKAHQADVRAAHRAAREAKKTPQ